MFHIAVSQYVDGYKNMLRQLCKTFFKYISCFVIKTSHFIIDFNTEGRNKLYQRTFFGSQVGWIPWGGG